MNPSKHVLSEVEDAGVMNLFLNMASGLTPDHLSKRETRLLERYCLEDKGHKDWFTEWGYDEEKGWIRSPFDSTVRVK